jgi:hypothetical protein
MWLWLLTASACMGGVDFLWLSVSGFEFDAAHKTSWYKDCDWLWGHFEYSHIKECLTAVLMCSSVCVDSSSFIITYSVWKYNYPLPFLCVWAFLLKSLSSLCMYEMLSGCTHTSTLDIFMKNCWVISVFI